MTDHFALDVSPDDLALAKKWLSDTASHLQTKGTTAGRTPSDIGTAWTGAAATTVKTDMSQLGADMQTYSQRLADASKALATLESHYRSALTQVKGWNSEYDQAQSDFDSAMKKADAQHKRNQDAISKGPQHNRFMVEEEQRDYSDQRSSAYDDRDTTVTSLQGQYDTLIADLKRYTKDAAAALHHAMVLTVPQSAVDQLHDNDGYRGKAQFELQVPRIDAEGAMGASYRLVGLATPRSTPAKDPTILPAGGPGEATTAGAITYEPSAEEGPITIKETLELSADPPFTDADGVSMQRKTFKVRAQDGIKAEADLGKNLQASLEAYQGSQLTYSVIAPVGQKMPHGLPPSPFDPDSIPVGTTVELNGDFFDGSEESIAAYKALHLSTSYEQAKGLTVGITKLPNNKIQVYTGPYDAVQNAIKFSVGSDKLNVGANFNDYIKDSSLQRVTFDLNSAEGRKAYWNMVLKGNVPPTDGPGVSDRATIVSTEDIHDASVSATIGDFTASLNISHSDGLYTVTTKPDGSKIIECTYTEGDSTIDATYTLDPSGKQTDEQFQLRLHNARKDAINAYNHLYAGSSVTVDHNQNVVLTFDKSDVAAIRERAYAQIAWSIGHENNGWDKVFGHTPTAADVKKWIAENRNDPRKLEMLDGAPHAAYNIAVSTEDAQVFAPGGVNLYSTAHITPDDYLMGLAYWQTVRHTGPDVTDAPGNSTRVKGDR